MHYAAKMKNVWSKRSLAVLGLGALLLFAAAPLTVLAAESSGATSGTPVPYSADGNLPIGTIIQPDGTDGNKVKIADITHLDQMFGAVVTPESLPLTITGGSATNQIYVATTGKWKVLVTTENGSIKAGDNVSLSNLKGTAMKATTDQEIIFGKALNNFDGKTNVISKTALKYDTGKDSKVVSIGLIQVAIDIRHNPDVRSTKTKLPPQLERLGEQIAEKELSPFRMYLCIAIVIVSIIIATVVLYSGIRSSILAIGRNPLSKKTIFKGLLQIIFVAFIILIIGLFTVYLLLKL
jgi:hypothetical protein